MIKSGIYCFTNRINSKKYIGQSINIQNRYNNHKWRYNQKNDSGYNCAFHSALRKYGWDNFDFQILEDCDIIELDQRERYWIKYYNTLCPNGYNISPGGQRYKINEEKHRCPICGKNKSVSSKLCIECFNSAKEQKTLLPLSDIDNIFIEKILDTSLEYVAKEVGYKSGNSLKKRLSYLNIPSNKEKMFKWYYENTGKKHPKEIEKEFKEKQKQINKNKQEPRKVAQYSLDGKLIHVYNSTKEAQREGFSSGHISECCRGIRKKYRNYKWKYLN